MYLRIEQINNEGLDLEFEEKPEVFPVLSEMINQGECNFMAPIKTALRAIRFEDMIDVQGHFNTLVRLPCGRCLKEYETPLKSRFEITYAHRPPSALADEEQAEVEISAAETGLPTVALPLGPDGVRDRAGLERLADALVDDAP